ncbi:hypothetical protein [Buttiauxella sp.]|uniref:hypothetical protein n=1 Tax=Buttiauxella sp. TaxID=1972222 RepID=UPI003C7948D2
MNIRGMIIKSVIGFVFGIPIITNLNSLIWHEYKFAKQEVDCVVDASKWITNLDITPGKSAENDILTMQNQLKGCVRNLDFGKSSKEFILEQYRRGV